MTGTTQKWALLIGVNFYFRGRERPVQFNHLRGCVPDVLAVEHYLKSVGVRNITKLTASDGGDRPTEEEAALPTHRNVVRELERIAIVANEGDLVYIHYSGHGIRRDRSFPDDEGDNISGTALALTDVMIGGAYLTGYQLGVWVRSLVEKKKLRVTVVLDSCFSGRGLRNGAAFTARTVVGEIDDSVLPDDLAAENAARVADGANIDHYAGHRNAAVRHSWLSNPTGCTVLAACGVRGFAGEGLFGSRIGGALTHYMLDILQRHPPGRLPTHARVSDYVRWKLASEARSQKPVLHGDGYYEFFGEHPRAQRTSCRVTGKGPSFELDVGRAQGVAKGATYDIYPETWDIDCGPLTGGDQRRAASPPRATITGVSDFTSTAMLLTREEAIPQNMAVQPGSRAVLRTWALPSATYARLNSVADTSGLDVLRGLQTEIERTPRLHLSLNPGITNADLFVAVDPQHNVEIQDENGRRFSRIPKVSLGQEDGVTKLAHIINHLARFQAIKNLRYGAPQHSLRLESFTFELLDSNGTPLQKASSGKYEVLEGQELVVSFVDNERSQPVHISIFNLNATWGVEKLHPGDGQDSEETLADKPVRVDVRMEIPGGTKADPPEIDDIIRAFIYTGEHPPTWDELTLPNLPAESSQVFPDLPVEAVLFAPDLSENPLGSRQMKVRRKQEREGQWAVLDFVVRTSRSYARVVSRNG
ncbi:hypothetical protein HIM_09766 [Hirsutella minnesotensis 3608]|uniref:Peptidase C14 caspase domain-containing protein n=1 Tax=Hirsutella minnesotensis 3608 TaxID=1043627 RepID=A0A0F7ZXJ9_9HYPO|nr:hypothetical protein HIM_09766 [Hirsutella minnesotensis 3608]